MNKEMYEVKVYISNSNNIVISQPNETDDKSYIVINPDQVDIIVKWLQEAKLEIENYTDLPF